MLKAQVHEAYDVGGIFLMATTAAIATTIQTNLPYPATTAVLLPL